MGEDALVHLREGWGGGVSVCGGWVGGWVAAPEYTLGLGGQAQHAASSNTRGMRTPAGTTAAGFWLFNTASSLCLDQGCIYQGLSSRGVINRWLTLWYRKARPRFSFLNPNSLNTRGLPRRCARRTWESTQAPAKSSFSCGWEGSQGTEVASVAVCPRWSPCSSL